MLPMSRPTGLKKDLTYLIRPSQTEACTACLPRKEFPVYILQIQVVRFVLYLLIQICPMRQHWWVSLNNIYPPYKAFLSYPLAELTECILNSSNRVVVTLVDILQDCKSTNLSYNSCKQSFCFFGIISY